MSIRTTIQSSDRDTILKMWIGIAVLIVVDFGLFFASEWLSDPGLAFILWLISLLAPPAAAVLTWIWLGGREFGQSRLVMVTIVAGLMAYYTLHVLTIIVAVLSFA